MNTDANEQVHTLSNTYDTRHDLGEAVYYGNKHESFFVRRHDVDGRDDDPLCEVCFLTMTADQAAVLCGISELDCAGIGHQVSEIVRADIELGYELEDLLQSANDGKFSDREMANLPSYGGEEPECTIGVWSWDEDYLLVGDCPGEYSTVERAEWIGEG